MLGLFATKRKSGRPKGRAKAKTAAPRKRRPTGAPKQRPATRRPAWKAHGPDALGLAVLFGAILMALSLAGSAGPVGRAIDWVLRGLFGNVSYLVPVATLLVSLAAFVRRDEAGRMLVGTSLLIAAISGVTHLVAGTAPLSGPYEGLATGGGVLGALLAVPLETYVGVWAGALACLFVGVLGALIVTKTPLRRAAEATWHGLGLALRWTIRRIVKTIKGFIDRRRARKAETVEPPAPAPEEPTGRATLRSVPDDNDAHDTAPVVMTPPEALRLESEEESTAPVIPIDRRRPAAKAEQPTLDLKIKGDRDYKLPPLTLLRKGQSAGRSGRGADDVSRVLERTLHDFGVDASVTGYTSGPTVTRFEIELGAGVKVSRVLSLSDDIAYALGSPDIRIIAPIPGKSAIGIEVPNRDRELVTVGDIANSPAWKQASHPLTCVVGKDIAGHPVLVNLAEMPHLLIAGQTGSGKSSCLNALISSLLMRADPADVRLILIDPKMVELTHFDELPHLLSPVVTHPKRAAETLQWVVREMERRYQELAVVGQRNLDLYNAAVRAGTIPRTKEDGTEREPLPYIAVFIDELADLMMVAARSVEDSICRVAQMARAVGIHLVVATQRPSVDVVTGLIKANIPSRIAFGVASQSDSRVIMDMSGAEKLIGHGDMLYLPTGTSKPRRVQGAYVGEKELEDITSFIRKQAETAYEEEVLEAATREVDDEDDDDTDDLLDDAMELVIRSQMGSTSMLQRKLKVGFARAGRIMDLLERKGVVGPQEGSKARAVLITPEQFAEMRTRT